MSGMRAAADAKKIEALAEQGTNPEDLVHVSLVAKMDSSNQAASKVQIDMTDQKAKASSLVSSCLECHGKDCSSYNHDACVSKCCCLERLCSVFAFALCRP